MIQIRQLKLPPGHTERELVEKTAKALHIRPEELEAFRIVRQSIDARRKPELRLVYPVEVQVKG